MLSGVHLLRPFKHGTWLRVARSQCELPVGAQVVIEHDDGDVIEFCFLDDRMTVLSSCRLNVERFFERVEWEEIP